jgi:dihydroorotase
MERGVIEEHEVTQEKLEQFLSRSGRRFYKLPDVDVRKLILERKGEIIPPSVKSVDGGLEVGLSKAGSRVFSLRWSTEAAHA